MNPQFSLENRLAYRFSILSTLNVRCVAGLYTKKFGLSSAGWRILSIIGRYEPIFPGVAAQLSTMDADKVTRAVDRLVEMGYVIRNTDAADRRRVILCLTSRGHAVYAEVEEASQDLDAQWRSVLTAEEKKVFGAALDKLDTQARRLFTGEMAEKRFVTLAPVRAAKRQPAAKATGKTAAKVAGKAVGKVAAKTVAKTAGKAAGKAASKAAGKPASARKPRTSQA